MREPPVEIPLPSERLPPDSLRPAFALGAAGPHLCGEAPPWLWPHQREALPRLRGSLSVFGGAILADSVGLGKTYVALALAREDRAIAVVPAALRAQWQKTINELGITVDLFTHEALSRSCRLPAAELVIVDEAHRFRNPDTRKYHRLACGIGNAKVLLITATPVVNRVRDLESLLRLFLADNDLAFLGLPSIEVAATDRSLLTHGAVDAVLVSRSAHDAGLVAAFPRVISQPPLTAPPVDSDTLSTVARMIDNLRFPNFGSELSATLLRSHLALRLYSSAAALRESVRRHLHYLDCARSALAAGGSPRRPDLRLTLLRNDPLQLDLLSCLVPSTTLPDAESVERERELLNAILDVAGDAAEPKLEALTRLLTDSKESVIVFTGATATAHAIARHMNWREMVLVTGRGGRIASGPVSLSRALEIFRRNDEGACGARVLVATDLLSEGLDLQHAGTVIHYDLPWTPVRIAQRDGRAARPGGSLASVKTVWFMPPPQLECRIRLLSRLDEKATLHRRLGLTGIGRSNPVGQVSSRQRLRERLVANKDDPPAIGYATVRGTEAVTAAALRWECPGGPVHEILCLGVAEERDRYGTALDLLRSHALESRLPDHPTAVFRRLIADRWRLSLGRPRDALSLRLSRKLLSLGAAAGRARADGRLRHLDCLLDRVAEGLRRGDQLLLQGKLDSGKIDVVLHRRTPPVRVPTASVMAVIAACAQWGGSPDVSPGSPILNRGNPEPPGRAPAPI